MQYYPLPVIIVSSLTPTGSELAMKALESGAIEVVPKPGSNYSMDDFGDTIVEKIRAASLCKLPERPLRTIESGMNNEELPDLWLGRDKIVAIGSSTGGAEALLVILHDMPPDCPGIVAVQHMPKEFTQAFAERLNRNCSIEVKEAEDQDIIHPGRALIAPGGFHMLVKRTGTRYRVKINKGPKVYYQRPSVDVLFQSVAREVGQSSLGVILTGMGSDGAKGLLAMREAGARTIAQDETTSVVFGMPKEAIRLGAVERVLPLHKIAKDVLCMASENRSPA